MLQNLDSNESLIFEDTQQLENYRNISFTNLSLNLLSTRRKISERSAQNISNLKLHFIKIISKCNHTFQKFDYQIKIELQRIDNLLKDKIQSSEDRKQHLKNKRRSRRRELRELSKNKTQEKQSFLNQQKWENNFQIETKQKKKIENTSEQTFTKNKQIKWGNNHQARRCGCGVQFAKGAEMLRHMQRQHQNIFPINTSHCYIRTKQDLICSNKYFLKVNNTDKSNKNKKKYLCPCNGKVMSGNRFADHIMIKHKGISPIIQHIF